MIMFDHYYYKGTRNKNTVNNKLQGGNAGNTGTFSAGPSQTLHGGPSIESIGSTTQSSMGILTLKVSEVNRDQFTDQ
jgi:hypothetical protein